MFINYGFTKQKYLLSFHNFGLALGKGMIVKNALWYPKEKTVKVSYSKYSGPKISHQSNLAPIEN